MINKICVVGGGTAGCISALILKTRFPHINVVIIESKNVGIVGVGESSTEHWSHFCKFIGVGVLEALIHCKATFKSGVYFNNWSDTDFIHSVDEPYSKTYGSYYGTYGYLISNDKKIVDSLATENKLGTTCFNNINDSPYNQFHFDTFALNSYLHQVCKNKKIDIIYDDLLGAHIDEENGNIKTVFSKTSKYESDFFIDCSGFSRCLLKEIYQIPWISYSKYLPLNSAIAFPTSEMEEYNKYTKSTARNAGWSWTIPVQGRTGNGYVYCDSFIGKDEAHSEMEKAYSRSLDIAREFKFDPGRLEKAWYKNCYAVGLSQSFVEPLEATSIGSVIQQMFCFIHFLPSYDVDTCNQYVNLIFDNIVDYVQSHYLVKREDTPFWKEVKNNLILTENLKSYLEKWKNRLPLSTDVRCPWGMFKASNYIPILYGLKWFNVDKIKSEYYNYYSGYLETDVIRDLNEHHPPPFLISHKKFIKEIINQSTV